MFDSLDHETDTYAPEPDWGQPDPAIGAPGRLVGPRAGRDPQDDPDDPYLCERCEGTGCTNVGTICSWCDGYGVYANSDGTPVSGHAKHPALRRHRKLLGVAEPF